MPSPASSHAARRAMVAARVFASPRLLDVPCRTVDQIPLVNALCRLSAVGVEVPSDAPSAARGTAGEEAVPVSGI